MQDAVIVAFARSPIGRAAKGSLAGWRPDELAALVARRALRQVPELPPGEIEDLMLGCALPGGEHGYNMARIVAVLLGELGLAGTTVTRYCASSLQTTRMAFHAIRAGEGDAFLSVGVEVVSRYGSGASDGPPGTENPRFLGARQRSQRRIDGGDRSWSEPGLPDVYIPMGQTAENVASRFGVSRLEQDEFALLSQQRAAAARAAGFFAAEIVPVPLPGWQAGNQDARVMTDDECIRSGTTAEALAALAPAFVAGGTVTAGNSCPLNDGASALVVTSAAKARRLGLRPLGRIVATAVSALHPEVMGMGPVEASRRALERAGMSIADIDLAELNEAFAAQVLASCRELKLDPDRVNVNGGAIALGHPFGMTGARMVGTLLHALEVSGKSVGLATLCVGGGQGMAMIVERA